MRGKGNGSLGHALFTSVKSIHSLHFPLALRTTTGFANHVGWITPLTRPAASSFLISSSSPSGIWSFLITAEEIKFSPAPPSTNILVTLRLRMVGETSIGKHPTAVVRSG